MNGVTSPARVKRVAAVIESIASAENVAGLYANRLQEMLASPGEPDSRLGLLRIAYEGSFRLDYSFASPLLTITATRALT
jgi:predicted component of type VI protein secretion system